MTHTITPNDARKRVAVRPGLIWMIALAVVPLPFVGVMWAFLGPMYRSMLLPISAGIVAYVWMLETVYLGCRPHWLDRIVGLKNLYTMHGMLGVTALLPAVIHRLELPAFGPAKLTGEIAFWILLAVGLLALALVVGWPSNAAPLIGRLRRALERVFRHEFNVWLHRVILVAVVCVCLHLNLVFYISEVTPFIVLANTVTAAVLLWYVWTRIREQRGILRGEVVSSAALSADVRELSVQVSSSVGAWEVGDFVFLRFPGKRGMREYHPFSIVSRPNSTGVMTFAIRADGDFTERVPTVEVGERVHLSRPFGRYRRFLDEHAPGRPVVFYAGGIGVTPLVPLAQACLEQGRGVRFLYSVKPGDELLYQDALQGLAQRGMSLTMLVGQFAEEELTEAMQPDALYLIGGPTPMLKAVKRLLRGEGVLASDIAHEAFEW